MTDVVLLVKASNQGQLKQIDDMLQTQFAELDVEAKVLGNNLNKWVQVSLSGEDEVIAKNFLNKEFGLCPMSLEAAKELPSLRGFISKVDLSKGELRVDVGIFEPKVTQATIPLSTLKTQFALDKETNLKQIAESFALTEGIPVIIKLLDTNAAGSEGLAAEFAPEQVTKLQSWQQSLLDRLIILGASKDMVDEVLERTHLNRDVIEVEVMGVFVHALTCKLGTYAAGLVPRMGRYMRNSLFVVFNARRSPEFQ